MHLDRFFCKEHLAWSGLVSLVWPICGLRWGTFMVFRILCISRVLFACLGRPEAVALVHEEKNGRMRKREEKKEEEAKKKEEMKKKQKKPLGFFHLFTSLPVISTNNDTFNKSCLFYVSHWLPN